MQIELRHAALEESVAQRLRIAANALAAHRIQARAEPWDGTHCDVVVINADDAYGLRVLEIARRRGVPVLVLGTTDSVEADARISPASATVAAITRVLHELLVARKAESAAKSAAPVANAASTSVSSSPPAPRPTSSKTATPPAPTSALTKLVLESKLAQVDLKATISGMTILLMPSIGRVLGASAGELLHARAMLGEDGWSFRPLQQGDRLEHQPGTLSQSLDSFLLQGAWGIRHKLPSFPEVTTHLREWPDLGSAAEIIEALKVVSILRQGSASPSEIVAESGIAAADVSACLWAFSASSILDRREVMQPRAASVAQTQSKPGLFARLAAHFGLTRH